MARGAATSGRNERFAVAAAALAIAVASSTLLSPPTVEAAKELTYFGRKKMTKPSTRKINKCIEAGEDGGRVSEFTISYKPLNGGGKQTLWVESAVCKENDEDVVGLGGDGCLTYTVEGPRPVLDEGGPGGVPPPLLGDPDPWHVIRNCGDGNQFLVGDATDSLTGDPPQEYDSLCTADTLTADNFLTAGGPWDVACSDDNFQPCGAAPYDTVVCTDVQPGTACQYVADLDIPGVDSLGRDREPECPLDNLFACRWTEGENAGKCEDAYPCTTFIWPDNAADDTVCPNFMECSSDCGPVF